MKPDLKKTFCADVRMINNSGIGVYIYHFIESVLSSNRYDLVLLGRQKELKHYFRSSIYTIIEADFLIYSIKEQIELSQIVPTCDLFWSPHYNIPILPIRAKKHLVTIPDVYHLAFFNTLSFSQKLYAKIVLNAAAFKADKITTISQYSADQIKKFLSINTGSISVIHLGLDSNLFRSISAESSKADTRKRYELPENYILFVGNVKPNKNLKALVAAFALIADQLSSYKLVIVGKRDGFINGDPTLFKLIDNDNRLNNKVTFTGYAALEDLPVIYSDARVFAFPSLYEGFGFPPLEAMACGTPVVASNRASIPEICGDAVLYADPDNVQAFAQALLTVCIDEEVRQQLIQTGLEHVKQYTWEKAGREFLHVIDTMLAS